MYGDEMTLDDLVTIAQIFVDKYGREESLGCDLNQELWELKDNLPEEFSYINDKLRATRNLYIEDEEDTIYIEFNWPDRKNIYDYEIDKKNTNIKRGYMTIKRTLKK